MNDPPGAPASKSRPGVPERPRESPVRDAPRVPAPDSRPAVPERPYEPPVDELPRPPAGAPARPDELPRPPALLAGAPPRLDAPPRWPAPDSRSAGTGCPWESRAPGSYREPLAPDRPVARGSVRRAGSEPTGRPRVPATGRLAGLRGVPPPPLERGRSDRSLLTGSIPFRVQDCRNVDGDHRSGPHRGKMSGGVLLSHAVPRAVPSALKGLASGFGMEPGVSLSLWPPKLYGDVESDPDRISGTAQWTRSISSRESKSMWSSPRPISTGQLHALPHFHFRPINPVV